MAILFLKPLFKERIWGNDYFKKSLHYDLDDNKYGELWSCSAINNDECMVYSKEYNNINLKALFEEKPELFNTEAKEFPLLIKLLSTSDKLSVQVHPDDEYARKVENCYGKTECWYFLKTEQNAKIVFGHHATSKEQVFDALKNKNLESLLDYKDVKQGDFAFIKSKTVHALGAGLLLLEVQQSSDITYRLYDYNRVDKNGKLRELHVEKGLDVLDYSNNEKKVIINYNNSTDKLQTLTNCEYFTVKLWNVLNNDTYKLDKNIFHIVTVAEGEFTICNQKVSLGESFIVTADEKEFTVNGNGKLLISYPTK